MKKILVAAAALVMVASPALAQSYDPSVGSGNLDSAAYARNRNNPIQSHQTRPSRSRAARQATPYDAYARTPDVRNGYRWPGALYDANGYFIDQNSPGRW